MLDQNDLQAIAEMIAASEKRMAALIREESSAATSRAIAYMENTVESKLDLIKEGLDLALETRIPEERIERIETDVSALKVIVREHSRELEELKKAQ